MPANPYAPQEFTGPFAKELMAPQYQEPTQFSGHESKGGAIIGLGSKFLEGLSKGRAMQAYRQEKTKSDQYGQMGRIVQQIYDDPTLTPDAKTRRAKPFSDAMATILGTSFDTGKGGKKGGGKQGEGGDQQQGFLHHFGGLMKHVAEGMTGGPMPKKYEGPNVNELLKASEDLPEDKIDFHVDKATQGFNAAVTSIPKGTPSQEAHRTLGPFIQAVGKYDQKRAAELGKSVEHMFQSDPAPGTPAAMVVDEQRQPRSGLRIGGEPPVPGSPPVGGSEMPVPSSYVGLAGYDPMAQRPTARHPEQPVPGATTKTPPSTPQAQQQGGETAPPTGPSSFRTTGASFTVWGKDGKPVRVTQGVDVRGKRVGVETPEGKVLKEGEYSLTDPRAAPKDQLKGDLGTRAKVNEILDPANKEKFTQAQRDAAAEVKKKEETTQKTSENREKVTEKRLRTMGISGDGGYSKAGLGQQTSLARKATVDPNLDLQAWDFLLYRAFDLRGRGAGAEKAAKEIVQRSEQIMQNMGLTAGDVIALRADLKGNTAAVAKLSTQGSMIQVFEDTLQRNAKVAEQLSEKWDRGDVKFVNSIQAAFEKGTGSKEALNLAAQLHGVSREWAKIMAGSTSAAGVPIREAAETDALISAAMSKGQLKSLFENVIYKDAKNRSDAFNKQTGSLLGHIRSMTGGPETPPPGSTKQTSGKESPVPSKGDPSVQHWKVGKDGQLEKVNQ